MMHLAASCRPNNTFKPNRPLIAIITSGAPQDSYTFAPEGSTFNNHSLLRYIANAKTTFSEISSIHIAMCSGITDQIIPTLFSTYPCLKYLYIECKKTTPDLWDKTYYETLIPQLFEYLKIVDYEHPNDYLTLSLIKKTYA